MPIYEYKCNNCGNCFERIVFASDDESSFECDKCGKKDIERLVSAFSRVNSGQEGGSLSTGCSSSGGFS
jgi:putative FmdB family regulatory protein